MTFEEMERKIKFLQEDEVGFYSKEEDIILVFKNGKNKNRNSEYEVIDTLPSSFIPLPSLKEISEYSLMQNFTNHIQDDDIKDELNDILHGRDMMNRFKKRLRELGLWQRFSIYRENAYREKIEGWMRDNRIGVDEE